jgi:Icc-related predicted phosphoesterase
VRIVHFSDWHGAWGELPAADLYVCTGDMLPNWPVRPPDGSPRIIDRALEVEEQTAWLAELSGGAGGLRRFLATPEAPVVVVRGNHDFVDFARWFGGDCFEIDENPSRTTEVHGLRLGGFRGIHFATGEWSDEIRIEDCAARAGGMPADLDIVVSHSPPLGMLDESFDDGRSIRWGACGFAAWLERADPRLCCFGHVHQAYGRLQRGATLLCNAATGVQVIELG